MDLSAHVGGCGFAVDLELKAFLPGEEVEPSAALRITELDVEAGRPEMGDNRELVGEGRQSAVALQPINDISAHSRLSGRREALVNAGEHVNEGVELVVSPTLRSPHRWKPASLVPTS
jgi:hypothetical protein